MECSFNTCEASVYVSGSAAYSGVTGTDGGMGTGTMLHKEWGEAQSVENILTAYSIFSFENNY
jgi:hypothetical protein